MFRRISYIVAALAAISFSLVSCLSENSWRTEPSVVPEGYVSVSFELGAWLYILAGIASIAVGVLDMIKSK